MSAARNASYTSPPHFSPVVFALSPESFPNPVNTLIMLNPEKMKYTRFVIYRNVEGKFYFRLFNARGKLLLTGPSHAIRMQCVATIHDLYTIVLRDEHYKISKVPGCYKFRLVTQELEVIAQSEEFNSLAGLAYSIHAVKKNVCIAIIEDFSSNVRYFTRYLGGQA